jgi:hypothetical protein
VEASQKAKPETDSDKDDAMYPEYEISQYRSAELLRQAEHERLVRETLRGRRAARREAAGRTEDGGASQAFGTGGDSHTGRPLRHRFLRTA